MTILDDIRSAIGAAFSDPKLFFSKAVLTRVVGGGGWTETPVAPSYYDCMAMVDSYSDHLRAVADIPGTDVQVLILGTSIAVDPLKGDTVTIKGRDYRIGERVSTDPARAMWTCQARPV